MAATTLRVLARGERLFSKGDVASGMYVVVLGEIKLIAHSPVRGERLTGVVGPGRSFGEPVMFIEPSAVVDAEAAGDALVLQLPKEPHSIRKDWHLEAVILTKPSGLLHQYTDPERDEAP